MTDAILSTILVTGFTVAFFHAAIPTHWLPFVLTARVQKWSPVKTLLITAFAGSGHVLFTALLGFLVAWCGMTLNAKIGALFPWIAGGGLILFGLYYVVQQWRGAGHGHHHWCGGHHHDHGTHDHHHDHDDHSREHDSHSESTEIKAPDRKSDWAAIASLFALLTFSPCEGFVPVYVSGINYGWSGFFLLTLILSVGTVLGMVLFTALTLAGMEKLKLQCLEKYERGILSGLLIVLGLLVVLFEH